MLVSPWLWFQVEGSDLERTNCRRSVDDNVKWMYHEPATYIYFIYMSFHPDGNTLYVWNLEIDLMVLLTQASQSCHH